MAVDKLCAPTPNCLLSQSRLCFVAVGELCAPKTIHNQRQAKSITVLVVGQYSHAHALTMLIIFIMLCVCDVMIAVLCVWMGSLLNQLE